MKFRNVITKEFYEAEKEDIKVKVEEYRQNPQAAIDESDDDNENDDDEEIDEVEIRRVDSAKKINRCVACCTSSEAPADTYSQGAEGGC